MNENTIYAAEYAAVVEAINAYYAALENAETTAPNNGN